VVHQLLLLIGLAETGPRGLSSSSYHAIVCSVKINMLVLSVCDMSYSAPTASSSGQHCSGGPMLLERQR
jgi:hypothetical protein